MDNDYSNYTQHQIRFGSLNRYSDLLSASAINALIELSGASSNISSAIDEKIKFLSSFSANPISGNLLVIKVTDNDYEDFYNASITSSLLSNAIYILDLSVMDLFGHRIVHVGNPIDNDDAATKKMVDDLSMSLSGYFKRDIENSILCSNTFKNIQKFTNISSYNLSSNNISSYQLSSDIFSLSAGSIISSYVISSTISVLNITEQISVDKESFFGNSTTIHVGESDTLCTLLSDQFFTLSAELSNYQLSGSYLSSNALDDYKNYNDTLSSLSNDEYTTEYWVNQHKSKVTINNDSTPTDLSVFKVTSNEYADIINERDILSNELYIIDDDEFVSVYGRQIKDVKDGVISSDAVNLGQLNSYKTQIFDVLSSAFLSAGITKETSIDSITYGHAISCIYFLAQAIMQ